MRQILALLAIASGVTLGVAAATTTPELESAELTVSRDPSGESSEEAAAPTPEKTAESTSPTTLVHAMASAVGLTDEAKTPALLLTAPENPEVLVEADPFLAPKVPKGDLRAHAYHYDSRVFRRPSKNPSAVGLVRRGEVLRAAQQVRGPGCKQGAWYTLSGSRGVVCSRDGFAISSQRRMTDIEQRRPAVKRAMPFTYAKARDGAPRFYRVPTGKEAKELAAMEPGDRAPEVVERAMDGVFLLALDELDESGNYYRTVRGRYVRKEDVELKEEPAMRGERLGKKKQLPFAFVYGEEEAPVYKRDSKDSEKVGTARKHARFPLVAEEEWGDLEVGVGPDGIAVPRERLRIARPIERPADVGKSDKWIHIDLDEQTLVAYEGNTPVFATLVSSGLDDGFATPTGLYQIREKHISTTMNGPDPDNGFYEVEEVPWTMYYHDSYAMHGAYWHNTFGNTRSHGCTNLSPIDARFLFYWTDDKLPRGWHAVRQLKGTWVYLTRADSA